MPALIAQYLLCSKIANSPGKPVLGAAMDHDHPRTRIPPVREVHGDFVPIGGFYRLSHGAPYQVNETGIVLVMTGHHCHRDQRSGAEWTFAIALLARRHVGLDG